MYLVLHRHLGHKTSQGWTTKPRILEGTRAGPRSKYWGRSPNIPISPLDSPLQIPRFHCPTLAYFMPRICMQSKLLSYRGHISVSGAFRGQHSLDHPKIHIGIPGSCPSSLWLPSASFMIMLKMR